MTSVTVSVAVVPLSAKSAASTLSTSSENVTRHFRVLLRVGEVAGSWRTTETTRGAAASGVALVTARSVKSATSLPAASLSTLSVPEVGLA